MANTTTAHAVRGLCTPEQHAPAHPIVRHADGRRTQRGELSFFTRELNRLGGFKSESYFDVPAESYTDGWVTGYRCAAELLDALERGVYIDVSWVIRDATEAGKESGGKPSRRGASAAFMEIMVEAIGFTVRHGRNGPWLAGKIANAERQRDIWDAHATEQRAKASARMKAQRQAKRTAQSANEEAAA